MNDQRLTCFARLDAKAGVCPLAAHGEILRGLVLEGPEAIDNLDEMLGEVPGIGFCLIGEGYESPMSAPSRSYSVVGQGRGLAGYR